MIVVEILNQYLVPDVVQLVMNYWLDESDNDNDNDNDNDKNNEPETKKRRL